MNSPQSSETNNFLHQWLMLSIALLLLSSFIAYNIFQEYRRIENSERVRLSAQTEIVEKNITPQLLLTYRLIDGIIHDLPSWRAENDGFKHANHLLKLIDDATVGISPIIIIQADGKVIASSEETLVGMNFAYREYFKTARKNPDPKILHISVPFKTVLNTYVISLFRTITGPHGEFAGIVIVSAVPEYFSILLDSVCYSPDMWAAIAHGDGKLFQISTAKTSLANSDLFKPEILFARHMKSGKTSNIYKGTVYATGENSMIALRTIQPANPPTDKPLVVAMARDIKALFSSWHKNAFIQSLLFGVIAISSSLGLFIVQRRQRDQFSERKKSLDELEYVKDCFQQALNGSQHILYRLDVKKGCYDYRAGLRQKLPLDGLKFQVSWND